MMRKMKLGAKPLYLMAATTVLAVTHFGVATVWGNVIEKDEKTAGAYNFVAENVQTKLDTIVIGDIVHVNMKQLLQNVGFEESVEHGSLVYRKHGEYPVMLSPTQGIIENKVSSEPLTVITGNYFLNWEYAQAFTGCYLQLEGDTNLAVVNTIPKRIGFAGKAFSAMTSYYGETENGDLYFPEVMIRHSMEHYDFKFNGNQVDAVNLMDSTLKSFQVKTYNNLYCITDITTALGVKTETHKGSFYVDGLTSWEDNFERTLFGYAPYVTSKKYYKLIGVEEQYQRFYIPLGNTTVPAGWDPINQPYPDICKNWDTINTRSHISTLRERGGLNRVGKGTSGTCLPPYAYLRDTGYKCVRNDQCTEITITDPTGKSANNIGSDEEYYMSNHLFTVVLPREFEKELITNPKLNDWTVQPFPEMNDKYLLIYTERN